VQRAIDFFKVKKNGMDMLIFEHLDNIHGHMMWGSRQNSKIAPRLLPPGGHTLHKTLSLSMDRKVE